MATRSDFETLLRRPFAQDDIYALPCKNMKDYNAQRMSFSRAFRSALAQGLDVKRIAYRKEERDGIIFLEIYKQSDTCSIFKVVGGTLEPFELDRVDPVEDEEYAAWAKHAAEEIAKKGDKNEEKDLLAKEMKLLVEDINNES
jgi:hypothetical protein